MIQIYYAEKKKNTDDTTPEAVKEYDSDINFSANRTFDMLGLEGVAKMCDVKKNTSICIKKLIPIHSLQDYDIIINELKKKDDNSSFLF